MKSITQHTSKYQPRILESDSLVLLAIGFMKKNMDSAAGNRILHQNGSVTHKSDIAFPHEEITQNEW
eukprot:m.339520 g.339520  ORF g.339520 m.339520 type:complete len:67 (+) comp20584_c0_seq10:1626-1826(+)